MAAQKLAVPADLLTVVDSGSGQNDPAKKASYAERSGGRLFQRPLDWPTVRQHLYTRGRRGRKYNEYKIVGKPIKREDIAPKVFAQEDFVTDVKVLAWSMRG